MCSIARCFVLILVFSPLLLLAQVSTWSPTRDTFPVIEGQAWPTQVKERYSRLPARAEKLVTKEVWGLSRNSAGLMIRFSTNAPQIKIRYTVEGILAFPHMPATGVSGVDLYGKDRDGKWYWFPGKYKFNDSITYSFSNLLSTGDTSGRQFEYRLYLPLYNTVRSLDIDYPSNSRFAASGVRAEKPIVVYGTSIAQGGCASRPGLAWTAVLERSMDRPLINLGFSGNGRLDSSVIDLLAEVDAKVFILDCLPNLIDSEEVPDDVLAAKIRHAVKTLQAKRPDVPIVLSEHSAGGTNASINLGKENAYEHANAVLRKVFAEMKSNGRTNIYLLSNEDIGFTSSATVDGEHPSDVGMQQNADAYEKLLRKILKEPTGSLSTTKPVSQSRDAFYFFPTRHQEVLQLGRTSKPETVFIGNSIVHMWGGEPASSIVNGKQSWDEFFKPLKTLNMGYGWDRVENVIWRIHHDELDGFEAKRIIVMIGTNNIGMNTDNEMLAGLKGIYTAIRDRQPRAKLYLIGIFPRTAQEKRVRELNRKIAALAKQFRGEFADPGKVLLDGKGMTNESLFSDGLHPNEEGYKRLVGEFRKFVK